jgi:hypothetical protein
MDVSGDSSVNMEKVVDGLDTMVQVHFPVKDTIHFPSMCIFPVERYPITLRSKSDARENPTSISLTRN